MDILKVDKEENGTMDVRAASSGKLLGCFMIAEDGFYNFWPANKISGYYSGDMLLELGRKLEEVNLNWNKHLDEYFRKK
jgi:hypothetical protein